MGKIYKSSPVKILMARQIKIESIFIPEIKRYFDAILLEFSKTGKVEKHIKATEDLLRKNYIRTSKAFSKDLRNQKSAEYDIDKEINVILAIAISKKTKEQSKIISKTNTTELESALITSKGDIEEAVEIVKPQFENRIEIIAEMETGSMAGESRDIEAIGISVGVNKSTKTWNALLDKRTRVSHAMADGQKVKILSHFIVAGEKLRFPKDASLGASTKNIMGCRCISEYRIELFE